MNALKMSHIRKDEYRCKKLAQTSWDKCPHFFQNQVGESKMRVWHKNKWITLVCILIPISRSQNTNAWTWRLWPSGGQTNSSKENAAYAARPTTVAVSYFAYVHIHFVRHKLLKYFLNLHCANDMHFIVSATLDQNGLRAVALLLRTLKLHQSDEK